METDETVDGLDGRMASLEKALNEEKRVNADLLGRIKYLQADLENFRKRTDRELAEAKEAQVRELVSRLIVVQDELDLAVKHAGASKGTEELKEGFTMAAKKLESALASVGVEKIATVGEEFDPRYHEAVEKVDGSGDADMVVEEVRPGYTLRGALLRPSMVKVELARKSAVGAEP